MEGIGEKDFDEVAWINEYINSKPDFKRSDLTALLAQLQHDATLSSVNVSKTFTKVASVNFRNIRNVETASDKIKTLQADLADVAGQFKEMRAKIQQKTVLLRELNQVKERIERVLDSVRMLIMISKKIQGMEDNMRETDDLMKLSEGILSARNDIQKLLESSSLEEGDINRMEFVRSIREYEERVEQHSTPQLKDAFGKRDTASAMMQLKLFKNIGLESNFKSILVEERKSEILARWRKCEANLKESRGAHEGRGSLKNWSLIDTESTLSTFFEDLVQNTKAEVQFLSRVFENAQYSKTIIMEYHINAFQSIIPYISILIEKALSSESLEHDSKIVQVLSLYNIQTSFVDEIESLTTVNEAFEECTLSPFNKYKERYGELESSRLKSEIKKQLITVGGSTISYDIYKCTEECRGMANAVEKSGKEALKRCKALTSCAEIAGLCTAFNGMISVVNGRVRSSLAKVDYPKYSRSLSETWKAVKCAFSLLKEAHTILTVIVDFDGIILEETKTNFSSAMREGHLKKSYPKITRFKEYVTLMDVTNPLQESITMMDLSCERIKEMIAALMGGVIGNEIFDYGRREWTVGDYEQGELLLFSLSPTNAISKIGDYFLTLAENLETLSTEDKDMLSLVPTANFKSEDMAFDDNNFCTQWLLATTDNFIKFFSMEVSAITEIDSKGFSQLDTDIQYIKNIIGALGIPIANHSLDIEMILQKSQLSAYKNWLREREE